MLQFQRGVVNYYINNTSSINMNEEQAGGLINGGDWISDGGGRRWKKTESASQKHAFAERKRRDRINHHYNTLRHLFLHLPKRDKATVLTEAVRVVKDLKKMVADVEKYPAGDETTGSSSFTFPDENDEATVGYCSDGGDGKTVIATVCCDDRPGLNRELTEAVKSVRGRAVKAEMSTIGGRTKVVVVVRLPESSDVEEVVSSLRRTLKAVAENRVLGSSGDIGFTGQGQIFNSSKRAEFVDGKRSRICSSVPDGLSNGLVLDCLSPIK